MVGRNLIFEPETGAHLWWAASVPSRAASLFLGGGQHRAASVRSSAVDMARRPHFGLRAGARGVLGFGTVGRGGLWLNATRLAARLRFAPSMAATGGVSGASCGIWRRTSSICSPVQTEIFGPSLLGGGTMPFLIRSNHFVFLTGIIAGIGGFALGSPMI
jgi:hypothetical protein